MLYVSERGSRLLRVLVDRFLDIGGLARALLRIRRDTLV
jgi:hypothetical protein